MKRSSSVAVVAGLAVVLAACESEVQTKVYETVDQCVAVEKNYEKCDNDFKTAQANHQKNAPVFKNKQECEAEFGVGKCEPPATNNANLAGASSDSATSFFTPMLMGYMLGNMMGSSSSNMAAQPLYRSRATGNFVNSGGNYVSRNVGRATVRPSTMTSSKPAGIVSRGGFGARASSSFGG